MPGRVSLIAPHEGEARDLQRTQPHEQSQPMVQVAVLIRPIEGMVALPSIAFTTFIASPAP
jgi:hypothetical protein